MTLFEGISLALAFLVALIGGGWALLQIHFSLKSKLEEKQANHTQDTISRLDRVIEKLAGKVEQIEEKLDNKTEAISKDFNELTKGLIANAAAIQSMKEAFSLSTASFAKQMDGMMTKLEAVYIGEGMYRVQGKKPKS